MADHAQERFDEVVTKASEADAAIPSWTITAEQAADVETVEPVIQATQTVGRQQIVHQFSPNYTTEELAQTLSELEAG